MTDAGKIIYFQLSGVRCTGESAERMHAASLPFGFDEVCATSQAYPVRGTDICHYVLAVPSGVAATVEIGFDTREAMMAWAASARVVEPTDESATACYRAIVAAMAGDTDD